MVKESMNAEVANAEEARAAGADALAGVRAETDMDTPRGLADRPAPRGPFADPKVRAEWQVTNGKAGRKQRAKLDKLRRGPFAGRRTDSAGGGQ